MTGGSTTSQRGSTTSRRGGDVLVLAAGLLLGVLLAVTLTTTPLSGLSQPGGLATDLGRLAAVVGTYGVLVLLVLVARIPWLERRVGQDRLVAWHRTLAPWALWLIAAHVVLTLVGYAQRDAVGVLGETWGLVTTTRWVLPAVAGFVLMVAAGVTSYRIARRRLSYETWWTVHLYTYLAIALAFAHQITLGAPFVASPWARTLWIGLYVGVAGAIVAFRVGLPVYRSLRHDLRVYAVVPEGPGVVSVWMSGRSIEKLRAEGGQFFGWRFLTRGLMWTSHPYSLSAPPQPGLLRITVKDLGDGSAALADLQPGTRVLVEGPYGAFTANARQGDRVVLVAGGVGITPVRALLEELPTDADVDLIYRASRDEDVILRSELDELARRRGTRVRYLVGRRDHHPMDPRTLARLVPDVAHADVYVCGPDAMTDAVLDAARVLGVPEERLHHEAFAF